MFKKLLCFWRNRNPRSDTVKPSFPGVTNAIHFATPVACYYDRRTQQFYALEHFALQNTVIQTASNGRPVFMLDQINFNKIMIGEEASCEIYGNQGPPAEGRKQHPLQCSPTTNVMIPTTQGDTVLVFNLATFREVLEFVEKLKSILRANNKDLVFMFAQSERHLEKLKEWISQNKFTDVQVTHAKKKNV